MHELALAHSRRHRLNTHPAFAEKAAKGIAHGSSVRVSAHKFAALAGQALVALHGG